MPFDDADEATLRVLSDILDLQEKFRGLGADPNCRFRRGCSCDRVDVRGELAAGHAHRPMLHDAMDFAQRSGRQELVHNVVCLVGDGYDGAGDSVTGWTMADTSAAMEPGHVMPSNASSYSIRVRDTAAAYQYMTSVRKDEVLDTTAGRPLGEGLFLTLEFLHGLNQALAKISGRVGGKVRRAEDEIDDFGAPACVGAHVEAKLQQLLDVFNAMVVELYVDPFEPSPSPYMADVFGAATTTPEGLYAAVQLAAWLHGAILRVTPYPSASGRTAHLLLDSVLGFFCPVPVFLRTAQRAADKSAVTDFRESCLATDGGVMLTPPRMLTPLVLDALHGAWTRLWACTVCTHKHRHPFLHWCVSCSAGNHGVCE